MDIDQYDATNPDNQTPDALTLDAIALDLSLASQDGSGWFEYEDKGDHIEVRQWGDDRNPGEIIAVWRVDVLISRKRKVADSGYTPTDDEILEAYRKAGGGQTTEEHEVDDAEFHRWQDERDAKQRTQLLEKLAGELGLEIDDLEARATA